MSFSQGQGGKFTKVITKYRDSWESACELTLKCYYLWNQKELTYAICL